MRLLQNYAAGDSVGAMKHLNAAISIRPSYMEALRLKERIISETNPDKIDSMGRKAVDKIDEKESPNWKRR